MRVRLGVAALTIALGALIWFFAREHLSVERLVEQERTLRAAIDTHPASIWLIGFVVYTAVSLVPGTSGKSIICGWLFGFWASLLMVTAALTLAGTAGFLLSRYLLQQSLRGRFGTLIEILDRHVEREGAFYMLTLRMMHVPFTLVNYCAGASGLTAATFVWTTGVGLIPSTAIFVGVGAALPTLEQLLEDGPGGVFSPALLTALVLMGAAPFLARFVFRKLRRGESAVDEDWNHDAH